MFPQVQGQLWGGHSLPVYLDFQQRPGGLTPGTGMWYPSSQTSPPPPSTIKCEDAMSLEDSESPVFTGQCSF